MRKMPKWMQDEPAGTPQQSSRRHEARVAEAVGGRVQPGSGAQAHSKGDVSRGRFGPDQFLIENKETVSVTMPFKAEWLVKVTREARLIGKRPAMALSFRSMSPEIPSDWVLIPLSQFKAFLEES